MMLSAIPRFSLDLRIIHIICIRMYVCTYIAGFAETISFNVSSIVPPSPIMATLIQNTRMNAQPNVAGGDHRMDKRPRSTSETSTQITLNLDE